MSITLNRGNAKDTAGRIIRAFGRGIKHAIRLLGLIVILIAGGLLAFSAWSLVAFPDADLLHVVAVITGKPLPSFEAALFVVRAACAIVALGGLIVTAWAGKATGVWRYELWPRRF